MNDLRGAKYRGSGFKEKAAILCAFCAFSRQVLICFLAEGIEPVFGQEETGLAAATVVRAGHRVDQ
jgi:hypothetical protein